LAVVREPPLASFFNANTQQLDGIQEDEDVRHQVDHRCLNRSDQSEKSSRDAQDVNHADAEKDILLNGAIRTPRQRTRQHGILYGTASGECRVKYLSVDAEIKAGDVVETAGLEGFFPKGVMVGSVKRAWKEPGQIYQVAEILPAADLGRLEEAAIIE